MAATTPDVLYDTAGALGAAGGDQVAAAHQLVEAAGGDTAALEAARTRYAVHLHGHADDWHATAALTLLNRALSEVGRYDKYDWRRRWARGRKP